MHPVKILTSLLLCLALQGSVFAQRGGIPFGVSLSGADAVPPTNLGRTGCGRLWLIGTNIWYRFAIASEGQLELRGPAGVGANGPSLYVLGLPQFAPLFTTFTNLNYCDLVLPPLPPTLGQIITGSYWTSIGFLTLTPEQTADLMAGLLYVNYTVYQRQWPNVLVELGETRGQIVLLDSDSDGVPDFQDHCPNTPPATLINSDGCTIEQLCPCDGPWRNHGEFLNRMRTVLNDFYRAGLISAQQHREIFRAATESDCGKVAGIRGSSR